jgi:hypothetical protein
VFSFGVWMVSGGVVIRFFWRKPVPKNKEFLAACTIIPY